MEICGAFAAMSSISMTIIVIWNFCFGSIWSEMLLVLSWFGLTSSDLDWSGVDCDPLRVLDYYPSLLNKTLNMMVSYRCRRRCCWYLFVFCCENLLSHLLFY